jgi:hypothetical protein
MSGQTRRRLTYLLRLWAISSAGELVWRASLEGTYTGERQGFASLEELCAFLVQECDRAARDDAARCDSPEYGW